MVEYELRICCEVGESHGFVDLMRQSAEIKCQAGAFQAPDIFAEQRLFRQIVRHDMQHAPKTFHERIAKLLFQIFGKFRFFRAAGCDCTLNVAIILPRDCLNVNGLGYNLCR